jgi:small GTP-binding protein
VNWRGDKGEGMADDFKYDVFLSHSSKDKDIVRAVAERLTADGLRVWFDEWILKPGDNLPKKLDDGLEESRVLVLFMSANAFDSDWAQLEAGTFRFRDPLNKERRFIPLRLDAAPIKGSLAQILYINWLPEEREQEYVKLLEACRPLAKPSAEKAEVAHKSVAKYALYHYGRILAYAFGPDGKRVLSTSDYNTKSKYSFRDTEASVRFWTVETGRCTRKLKGHTDDVRCVVWSTDQRYILTGSDDYTIRIWDMKTKGRSIVLNGHFGFVASLALSADQLRVLSGSSDKTVRLWDVKTGHCLRVFKGHTGRVLNVAWSGDQQDIISCSDDKSMRLWDVETGGCGRVFVGHSSSVLCVAWGGEQSRVLSGSDDKTLRLWDVNTGICLKVLEGHTAPVTCLALGTSNRLALSGSNDETLRLWDLERGRCLSVLLGHRGKVRSVAWSADQRHAFSGDEDGGIRVWDLSQFVTEARAPKATVRGLQSIPDQVQYTNAKVLVVGDTSAGKTGLAHRLATGQWKPSDGSTVGAWSTQWPLPDVSTNQGKDSLDREIWLWDFGGQADQRLVHQLYMDRAALILLLFDADKEDVLPGLREWQMALRRCVPATTPLLLVAGRIDTGFKASRGKLQKFAEEQGFRYFETSAKDGTSCQTLSQEIKRSIPWEQMEKRTSPRIFKLIKDEILKLRDAGGALYTFKELRDELWRRLPQVPDFNDRVLETVVSLLDAPGVVKDLDYGTYILLQPAWVNIYAQAVLRTLRQEPSELGCLPLRSIAEGKLLFQTVERDGSIVDMRRLPEAEERVVLREMERQLEERGLCLRQGDKLVFPSHCGRERPVVQEHPAVFVSYAVQGYLDDIYATLVVKLADSESFKLKELWRDAADFVTLAGDHQMGVKLTRGAAGSADISVYFAPGVTKQEQVIFANYIHAHLQSRSEKTQRLRHYVCPHCHASKGNPQVLMQKLLSKKTNATVECDICEERFSLWDDLEMLFASAEVRERVEDLQVAAEIRLDSRRKGKLLVLEVTARITSADQKCFEIPATEDEGIDMELEFTDDEGKGTGRRLYLQLKSGNSHLEKRKDGREIFKIKEQRWVDYWLKQPHPVMLVIGTFAEDDERSVGKEKLEFTEIHWMEISSVLKRESQDGKKPVRQIEFKGERLDMSSVRRWREAMLK